jgi:hypothetical protein
MITTKNPTCLGWKYPGVQGITTRDGVITNWPAILPELTQELIQTIEYEYDIATSHIQP